MTITVISPKSIAYDYAVKGKKVKVVAAIANGDSKEKAFVMSVKFFTKDKLFISDRYVGLSFSKLGAYKYLQGGTSAKPKVNEVEFYIPKTAKLMQVSFAAWECEALPITSPLNVSVS